MKQNCVLEHIDKVVSPSRWRRQNWIAWAVSPVTFLHRIVFSHHGNCGGWFFPTPVTASGLNIDIHHSYVSTQGRTTTLRF